MNHHIRSQAVTPESRRFKTRQEKFMDAYQTAVEILRDEIDADYKPSVLKKLSQIDFAVEMVIPYHSQEVTLGKLYPADAGVNARIVIYRAPIERRARDLRSTSELIYNIIEPIVKQHLGI
jgi:hypothetical protein